MEHTEKYLQAKWVTENPDGYDERDVVDAKKYCNAYLDGYNQALRIHDVVGQSELLKAFVEWQIQGNTPYAGMFIDEHIRAYFKSL